MTSNLVMSDSSPDRLCQAQYVAAYTKYKQMVACGIRFGVF